MYGSIQASRKSVSVNLAALPHTVVLIPDSVAVDVAGSITGKLMDDTVAIAHPVTVGMNPLRFKTITAVSGPTVLNLYYGEGTRRAY